MQHECHFRTGVPRTRTWCERKSGYRSTIVVGAIMLVILGAGAALAVLAPPTTPNTPTVADLGGGVAEISWVDVDLEDGYDVQRESQKGNGGWFKTTVVATVGNDVTTTTDDPGLGTYRYRVRAFNADGASAWSGWTEITLTDNGGGGDPPPTEWWIAWFEYPPDFVPIAPVVEGMAPEFGCVINGNQGPLDIIRLLNEELDLHFTQGAGRWPDFGDGPHPCPNCPTCAYVLPTTECGGGQDTYPLDSTYAFHIWGDGLGNLEINFLATGDPPGGKNAQRFESVVVPVQAILWDDPNNIEISAFTLVVRQPCLLLDQQTGPSSPRYISIGDIRFEKWLAP